MKLTPKERVWRDRLAEQVMCICMADLSRQIATEAVRLEDTPKAIEIIAQISFTAAYAMLRTRRKESNS